MLKSQMQYSLVKNETSDCIYKVRKVNCSF